MQQKRRDVSMEFNFHIETLGKYSDIYSLFKYLNYDLELEQSFFLESVQEESKELLFSFICLEPDYILEITNNKYKFKEMKTEKGEAIKAFLESNENLDESKEYTNFKDKVIYNVKALDLLEKLSPLDEHGFYEIFPRNVFYGGYLGYIGYDIVSDWVGYSKKTKFPDVMVGMHTKVLIFNHRTNKLYYIENTLKNGYEPPTRIIQSVKKYKPLKPIQYPKVSMNGTSNIISNVNQVEYFKMIEKIKEYIYDGDIIQAVLSRKLKVKSETHDMDIYGALRQINPSPYIAPPHPCTLHFFAMNI